MPPLEAGLQIRSRMYMAYTSVPGQEIARNPPSRYPGIARRDGAFCCPHQHFAGPIKHRSAQHDTVLSAAPGCRTWPCRRSKALDHLWRHDAPSIQSVFLSAVGERAVGLGLFNGHARRTRRRTVR